MKIHTIYSGKNSIALYEGNFESFSACLEQAIEDGVDLSHADLKNRNLANACLDDALLRGADFSNTNLTGANISEADLCGSIFSNTDLYNTCFACADLRECDFTNAFFGGTEIADADIRGAQFSTLSCFSLDFANAEKMKGCRFIAPSGRNLSFSAPPVVVRGLGSRIIVFMEECWMHGLNILPYPENFHPIPEWLEGLKTTG